MGNIDRRKSAFLKMDLTAWLSIATAVVTLATPALSSSPRVVCYYTNWSVYRPGTAKFNPQNINPYLCTHLVYAFGGFTKDNTLKPFDKYQDIEKGGYAKFNGLKTYNKELKTLLAIGGWNEGSSRFSPMVASKDRRREFVRNAIKFLRQNHFDGLDLDWEYPAFRDGGKAKDRENYSKLVKELRGEFEKESQKTGKPRLLLTMAVPAGIEYIEKGFDVKTLTKYLDWMNLLTYDYHSAFEPAVNHHAPLYPLEEPNEYSVDNELNIDYTIKFYLENGAEADKLVLGIPTYGRSYTLFNADAVELGSPADGPGDQGDATREKGYLAYYEICEALMPKTKKRAISSEEDSEEESDEEEEEEKWTVMYPNPDAMGPVAYKGNQWVGYDDAEIVKKKAQYVVENGLGGIMFWSIDNDDFRGVCSGKPYPLIEAAKEAYLNKLGSTKNTVSTRTKERSKPSRSENRRRTRPTPTTTTTTTTTTRKPAKSHKRKSTSSTVSTTPSWNVITPEPPTTPDPGSDFKCTDEGFFPHPRDCKKYFWCLDSGPSELGIVAHAFTCPSGLYFNKAADSCDFARNVLCKKTTTTTKATTKPTTTTTATTTTTTTTTTRRPIRLSSRSSLLFRSTTTTTTPEPELSEEVEDEEDAKDDAIDVDAEDPKVIKELIDLIKKVGGVEQLEKQLKLSESPEPEVEGAVSTTPNSFNTKLYQKVLERARGKNKFGGNSITQGGLQNSRRGPQNEGIEPATDKDRLLRRDRPQYVTINRARSSTTSEPLESDEDEEESEEIQETVQDQRQEEPAARVGTTSKPLQYVNIRRSRPTTAGTTETPDESRNALFERDSSESAERPTRAGGGGGRGEEGSAGDSTRRTRPETPEYVTLRRGIPTTETTTPSYRNSEEEAEGESKEAILEKEVTSQSPSLQYNSIVRTRSTTLAPEEPSNPDPTTVLSVQISSLLNSPNSDEGESQRTDITTAQIIEASEPETTTSTTVMTTTTTPAPTTTTTSSAPPSTTTRRNLLRRRGSTTPTTPTTTTPATTTQGKERRTFLRRTKATAPPVTDEDTNTQTTTSKYIRRGENKFKTRKTEKVEKSRESNTTDVQPSLNDTAPSNERPNRNFIRRRFGGVSSSTTQSSATRRPLRVASRRRPFSTTTTTTSSTLSPTTARLESEESLQDIGDTDAIEDPSLQSQLQARKATNVQRRRPLVQLKSENDDQNSSATNEEEKRRQSKKYSASFKQNQLDEIIKLRASAEEVDVTTEGRTTVDDTSVETAVALAAHQLLSAPIPIIPDYDEESKPARTSQTIIDYKFTSPEYSDLTKTQSYSEEYSRTPSYTSRQRYESSTAYTSLQTDSDPRSSTPGALTESNLPSGFTTTGSYTNRFTRPTTTTNTVNPTVSGITLNLGSEGSGESTARYTNYQTELNPSTYTTSNYEYRTLKPGLSTNIINPTSLNLRESTVKVYTALERNVQPTYGSTFSSKVSRPSAFSPNLVNIDEIEGDKSTVRYQGSNVRGPSTARYQGSSEKISVPVAVGYSTSGQGLQEPSYFTREYLLESPVTRTYEDEYQYLSPATTPQTTSKKPLRRKTVHRRISSTYAPSLQNSPASSSPPTVRISPTTQTTTTALTTPKPRRTTKKTFQKLAVKKAPIPSQETKEAIQKTIVLKINNNSVKPVRPISDYDYYDDSKEKGVNYEEDTKVLLHEKGNIECLDVGNFAHPTSCKMFISCARTKGGLISGWEYICPRGLSFDPVGGICNWSAGLGCNE